MVFQAEDKSPNLAIIFLKILVVLLPLIWSRPAVGQQTVGEKVFKTASPSIVTVQSGDSTGTAFLVRDKNTFVTAAHVIEDGAIPVIRYGKGSFLAVRAISYSKALDLAILETEDPFSAKPLALGDKEELSPGASVFAIGTALGALTNTLTDGMISGSRRAGNVNLVQVTSPFSPGMSGGPVLSKDSKVLGVISFSFTEGQNLNIAVAAKHVRELLAAEARPTEVVCEELRKLKSTKESTKSAPSTVADPNNEPSTSESDSGSAAPMPGTSDTEQDRDAREQALADALSEVRSIACAASNDCYRIYRESRSMEEWRAVQQAVDLWKSRLPLIKINGRSTNNEITTRLAEHCSAKEFEMLAEVTISIARAMDEMSMKYGLAIIDIESPVTSQDDASKSFKQASDSDQRLRALTMDFYDLIESLHPRKWKLRDQLSNKYYAGSAIWLGVQPDYERPNVPAVKWVYSAKKSNFQVGDVITGLRLSTIPTFFTVNNWTDVNNFMSRLTGKVSVEVKVRGDRTFYVTVEK